MDIKPKSSIAGPVPFLQRLAGARRTPWLVLAVSLAATGWIGHAVRQATRELAQIRFANRVTILQNRILERTHDNERLLLGGAGLFAAAKEVTRASWRAYVDTLQPEQHYPGIQGVGFAQRVLPADLAAHTQRIQAEGFTNYTVRPEGERTEYFPIIFLEPLRDLNLRAFGYDMFSEPVRRAAMERARDEGRTMVSGAVILVQEITNQPSQFQNPVGAEVTRLKLQGNQRLLTSSPTVLKEVQPVQHGFLMYQPVYAQGRQAGTVAERRAALQGFAYSPFRAGDFFDAILLQQRLGIRLELYDGAAENAAQPMYDSASQPKAEQAPPGYRPAFRQLARLAVYGQTWTAAFYSLPSFESVESTLETGKPVFALAGGLVTSCLLFGLVLVQASRNRQQQRADEAQARLAAIVAGSDDAIIGKRLDGTIESWNAGAERLYGYLAAEAIGQRITLLIPPECSADEAKILGQIQRGECVLPYETVRQGKDGRKIHVALTISPVRDSAGRIIGTSTIARDITARKQIEQALQERTREMEEFNKAMLGRESRVIELKEEVNRLAQELGRPVPYPPVWEQPPAVPAGDTGDAPSSTASRPL